MTDNLEGSNATPHGHTGIPEEMEAKLKALRRRGRIAWSVALGTSCIAVGALSCITILGLSLRADQLPHVFKGSNIPVPTLENVRLMTVDGREITVDRLLEASDAGPIFDVVTLTQSALEQGWALTPASDGIVIILPSGDRVTVPRDRLSAIPNAAGNRSE